MALAVGSEKAKVGLKETGCWDAWDAGPLPSVPGIQGRGPHPPTSCGTGHILPWGVRG